MDRIESKKLRSILFRHLDGISICSTVGILYKQGVIEYILNNKKFTIIQIIDKFNCNPGYINIALRLLASQGWIERFISDDEKEIDFLITDKGERIFVYAEYYYIFFSSISVFKNIKQSIFEKKDSDVLDKYLFLIKTLKKMSNLKNIDTSVNLEMTIHLQGLLIGPILVSIGTTNYFDDIINRNLDINFNILCRECPGIKLVKEVFIYLDLIENKNNKFYFTQKGKFFIKRSSSYGVTVSYLPTFEKIKYLLFGDPEVLWKKNSNDLEMHVDRTMNVWGSGGAHKLYFKKIDDIIITIFNQPLHTQPLGISDMGCGDGTFLKHLYNVVLHETLRGANINEFPLKIIGADYNHAARLASIITLQNAKIDHLILSADISNPDEYADNLRDLSGLELRDMLNVRSFLDHNRIYQRPNTLNSNIKCDSTGAFSYKGKWIKNKELKENLIMHFKSWFKYINKYGLLILELHTIDPRLVSKNLGLTATTAYDATHGYSDQYIVEVDIMMEAALHAGLEAVEKHCINFPTDELANVSINLLKSKN